MSFRKGEDPKLKQERVSAIPTKHLGCVCDPRVVFARPHFKQQLGFHEINTRTHRRRLTFFRTKTSFPSRKKGFSTQLIPRKKHESGPKIFLRRKKNSFHVFGIFQVFAPTDIWKSTFIQTCRGPKRSSSANTTSAPIYEKNDSIFMIFGVRSDFKN